jgi:CRISPR-associated endonuclease Csn1
MGCIFLLVAGKSAIPDRLCPASISQGKQFVNRGSRMKTKFPYRLGLDIGTNSIGWCVYRLNDKMQPEGIHRAGVRIFSDGREAKTAASLAAARRLKRQMRRRHDRVLKRQQRFMQILIEAGLMPADPEQRSTLSLLDPYELRARALDEKLSPSELGRALYHLCKRRGFQSSRKDQGEDEKESGKIKEAIRQTREMMESHGCRTYGEYLAAEHSERRGVRARSTPDGKGYIHYPQRAMVADEFDQIWQAQNRHHPDICTDKVRDELRDSLLFQRKLRPVEPGTCIFEANEPRIPLCSPLQQRFRLLQELNNIRIGGPLEQRPLSLEERDRLKDILYREDKLTFAAIKKCLAVPRNVPLNLESGKKRELKGDVVSAAFCSKTALGDDWWKLSAIQQEALAMLVENAVTQEELVEALSALPKDVGYAKKVVRGEPHRVDVYYRALFLLPNAFTAGQIAGMSAIRLPDGYGSLSRRALEKIVPQLESDVITYDQAVRQAGYVSHSDFYDGEIYERLPYYGVLLKSYTSPMPSAKNPDERQYGRLANPTVHIGLNQIRLVVNEMLRRWGWPEEIVVEVAREFGLSGQRRREIEKEQEENQKRNESLNERLRDLKQRENRENRQRLMLWDELGGEDAMDRHCVYSGQRLSMQKLFSAEIEIDHILPYSRTLDDSLGNKILCLASANRIKRNQTPYEAFGHSPKGYDWQDILSRAERLPGRKAARFREEALNDYVNRSGLSPAELADYGFQEGDGFLARHLTDTAYLSRVARRYLTAVCSPNKVWVVTGRVTSKLRYQWKLDAILDKDGTGKNRNDHRHHAVDAAVVALCDRSMLQKMSAAAKEAEALGENRLFKDLPLPWVGFKEELEEIVEKIVISHRPSHAPEAGLHNDTNYGFRDGPDKKGGAPLVVHRVPLESLKNSKDAEKVHDAILREKLIQVLGSSVGAEAKSRLLAFSEKTGIRRVRIAERISVIPIHHRKTGQAYRYVKGDGNYCYDIFQLESGKWAGDVVSLFDANQPGFKLKSGVSRSGMPLMMRLRKNDVIAIEEDGKRKLLRVAKFSDGIIALAEHQESNVDSRDREKDSGFSYLRKSHGPLRDLKARLVGIDPLGYVNDPGPRE